MQEQRYSNNKLHERRKYILTSEYTGRKTIKQIQNRKRANKQTKTQSNNIDMDNVNDNEIELDINQRNFSNIDDKCKLLHVYTNERTNKRCAII